MIRGHVNQEGEPIVVLQIEGVDIRTVIDNGFNGDLIQPDYLRSSMYLKWAGDMRWTLANNTEVVEDMYRASIEFDGQIGLAEVSFTSSAYGLMGKGFLGEY